MFTIYHEYWCDITEKYSTLQAWTQNQRRSRDWAEGMERWGKVQKKELGCAVCVSTPHKECEHYVLHM